MSINFEYYKIFYYVAKYKSFTTAAQVLYSNQPSVTRYIRLLEAELGCLLFVRSQHGVTLTAEGQLLYQYVEPAYKSLVEGEQELQAVRQLSAGTVYIDSTELAIRCYLMEKLMDFRQKYPNIHINISANTAQQSIADLVSGKCEFSIVSTPVWLKEPLRKVEVEAFQDIFVAAPEYVMPHTGPFHVKELQRYPLISLSKRNNSRLFYEDSYQKWGLTLKAHIEMNSVDLLPPLIAEQLGIGIIPDRLVKKELQAGRLVEIETIETLPKRHIAVVWDPRRSMSLAGRTFFSTIQEHL